MSQNYFLQDEAYRYLSDQVRSGGMEPGKTYSLNTIARELRMSRTPVRDALQKLAQEGLVESLPSRGFRLKTMSDQQVWELYQIRCALEGYCCRQLAQRPEDPDFFAELQANLDRQRQAAEQGEGVIRFLEIDRAFHHLLLARLGNGELEKILENDQDRINGFALTSLRREGILEQVCREHEEIASALRRGAPEAAEAAMLRHLKTAICPWPPEAER